MTARYHKQIRLFFIAIMIAAAFLPVVGFADKGETGLVPCGNTGQDPCDPCHAVLLIIRLTNFIVYGLAGPLALLMLMYAGFVFAFSGGSPTRIVAGKTILKNTVIGLLIVVAAFFIVDTAIKVFTGDFKSASSGEQSLIKNFGPWNAPKLIYDCGGAVTPQSSAPKIPTNEIVGYITSAAYVFGLFLTALSAIMILFSAYTYITSAGNAEKIRQARQILIFALVGIAVALLASTLPRIVVNFFK